MRGGGQHNILEERKNHFSCAPARNSFPEEWTCQPLFLRFFNHLLHCFQAWFLGGSPLLNLLRLFLPKLQVSKEGASVLIECESCLLFTCCLLINFFSLCQTNKRATAWYWRGTAVFWSCCCFGDFSFLETNCCWRLLSTDIKSGMPASIWTTTKVRAGIFMWITADSRLYRYWLDQLCENPSTTGVGAIKKEEGAYSVATKQKNSWR